MIHPKRTTITITEASGTLTKLEKLIDKAWFTNDKKRASQLARQILDISPENVEALLILADNFDESDDDAREALLMRALKSLEDENVHYSDDVKESLFVSVYYRLAYTLFAQGKFNEVLSSTEKTLDILKSSDNSDLIDFDIEDDLKTLRYRALLELERWQEVLSVAMKDEDRGLSWAYSRLVAAWMTAPVEQRYTICANMFFDALAIAPDVPFYILGYYDEPDDETGEFLFSVLFSGILSMSEEFYHWFTRGSILFGLLTNRFENKERDYLLDVLDSLGGYEEYEKMAGLVTETDDMSVIEAMAANKCLRD